MGYQISIKTGEIKDHYGNRLLLEPRLAKLYETLYRHRNHVVSRDDLTNEIWPDTVVNEDSLTRAISDLRKYLNEQLKYPPEIITQPKRGYKLILPAPPTSKTRWMKIARYTAYVIGIFILIILVIRGFNY